MKRMGCGCDMGCRCKELGCGCDMGCGSCHEKGMLGQIEKTLGMNPVWFIVGAGVGVGLWYLLRSPSSPVTPIPRATMPAGNEKVMAVPQATAPSKYASIDAVAQRLQDISQLYPASITPEDALAQSEQLKTDAKAFNLTDAAKVSSVLADISDFQDRVKDFIQFKKDNPSVPQFQPAGTAQPTGSGIPVSNLDVAG